MIGYNGHVCERFTVLLLRCRPKVERHVEQPGHGRPLSARSQAGARSFNHGAEPALRLRGVDDDLAIVARAQEVGPRGAARSFSGSQGGEPRPPHECITNHANGERRAFEAHLSKRVGSFAEMLGEEIALIQNQLRDDMRAEIDGLEREIEALRSRLGRR